MHSNTRKTKVNTNSSITLPQSAEQKAMNSASGGHISLQGIAGSEMQSNKEGGFMEHEYISGRPMIYSASETVDSSGIGGKMDHQGVIVGDFESNRGVFTENPDLSGGRTMVYSSSGTVTSSQAAGKIYRYGSVEGGMRSSKDSGIGEQDNVSQNSNDFEVYTETNLVKAVGLGHLTQTSDEFQIELSENDEEALKEELLHIFERERTSLGMYFKKKMEEVLRGFRTRQMEWDESTRAEKAELERNMSMEKMEMQKNFADEIAKLTQSFNDERQQLEQYYQEQLKDLREKLATEQRGMTENFATEKIELKEKLEAEYQVTLKREISLEKQEAFREKTEMEVRFNKEKHDIEKNFNLRLTESETNVQRIKAEFETNLTQERIRMEREFQEKIRQLEEKLQVERQLRLDVEKQLELEKEKHFNEDSSNKKENERLKSEVDVLRLEIKEKTRITLEMKSFEETVTQKGRDGLSGKLKDDFEKLLADHKMELDKTYHREKEVLDQTLQAERRQIKEELDREKDKMKSEKDEIRRTKERLQVESQAQIDRQRQQRSGRELARQSVGNFQVDRTDEVGRGMRKEQMGFNERLGLETDDHRTEIAIGRMELTANSQQLVDDGSDAKGHPYWQQYQRPQQRQQQQQQHQEQQTNKDSVWTGVSAGSHVAQHGFTASYQQLAGNDYSLRKDPTWQPHDQASFEYREKRELPRNQPGAREIEIGSVEQSGLRGNSMYLAPSENESTLRFEITAMKSENEGLKAKVTALEENIDLHKKYKGEAKAEMERLLKANQDNEHKIQTLKSAVKDLEIKNSEKEIVKRREHERQVKSHTREDRVKTAERNDSHLEGKLRGLETRAAKAEKTSKEHDAKLRILDEGRRENRREDSTGGHLDIRDRRSASNLKDKSRYESLPTTYSQEPSYKAKYEAVSQEKNKLLQVTKELQMKIKALEEKQAEILQRTSHLEKSSEESGETERLKQLVSENSSLKERTSELQNQLQRLLEKLKNEKEKATSFETEISTRNSSNLHNIQGLHERLVHTGRELSGSRGELDTDALRRIETEIFTIGQIIKTQFGEGSSRGDLSQRSMSEDAARIAQLEVEKKDLETKLKLAREAMNEYVARLNDKMQDVKSMTGMSEEMVQELRTRNNNLKKSLQALEEGQKTSHLQNEQLRHQKSALQSLIGDLTRHEEPGGTSYNASPRYQEFKRPSKYDSSYFHNNEELDGTSYNSSSKYLDTKYTSKYPNVHESEKLDGTSYKASSRYPSSKYESKYDRSYDNRYDDFHTNTENRYSTKELKEMQDGEKLSRGFKGDQFSFQFQEYPCSKCSRFEHKDFEQISASC